MTVPQAHGSETRFLLLPEHPPAFLFHLLDVRVLWDFQQFHLLLLCLGNEGIFNVISGAAAEWHRNDLGWGWGRKREILHAGPREVVPPVVPEK